MALNFSRFNSIAVKLRSFRWTMFIVGAASMWAQVAILRELLSLSHGNELVLGIGLSLWLALVGFWSWVGGHFTLKSFWFDGLLALAPLFFLASLWLLPLIRPGSILVGETGGLGREVIVSIVALLPPTAFAGLAYALGVSRLDTRRTTATYAAETLGAAVAGALVHFLLAEFVGNIGLMLVAGAVCSGTAVFLFWPYHRFFAATVPLALFVIALTLVPTVLQRLLQTEAPGERLLYSEPSRYGRITITEREGQRSFHHNGVLLFSTEDKAVGEERVHLPMLLHPAPKHVLLMGGCLGGALTELLRHGPSHVDCLEWDPAQIRLARRFLDVPATLALADPRVSIIETDGRVHFRKSRGRYDVILMISPVPKNAFLGRLLSVEAMYDARDALKENGLFALATPGRASHFDRATLDWHSMLASTLALAFPYTGISPGEISHFWGAKQPVPESVALLSGRLYQREIRPMVVGPVWLSDRFFPLHLQTYRELLRQSPPRAHSELHPAIFLLGMIEELTLTLPWLAHVLSVLINSSTWVWGFLATLLGLALLFPAIRRDHLSPRFAVLAVSAAGMSIEILILFAFQTMHGHLYHALGGILALFMGGGVLGAYGGRWLAGNVRGVGWACAFAAGVSALTLWALAFLRTNPDLATLVLSGLAILAGVATAAVYAPSVACVLAQRKISAAGARIYAFDLLGGAIAALVATWIVIPMLGFAVLALVATFLCASATLANTGTRLDRG